MGHAPRASGVRVGGGVPVAGAVPPAVWPTGRDPAQEPAFEATRANSFASPTVLLSVLIKWYAATFAG